MTPIEFLEQCFKEDLLSVSTERQIAEVNFKQKILDFHKNWPILVQGPSKFEFQESQIDQFVYKISSHINWMVEDTYRNTFGVEPPTAPMIKEMLKIYSDRPDYNPNWI